MPKGVYDHWKIRGITKEENPNLIRTEESKLLKRISLSERGHGPNCNCCICQAKRGESEGVGKGKTYEEIYGFERAEEEKTKRRHSHPGGTGMIGDKNPARRPEVRAKLRAAGIQNWEDPEYKKKQLEARFKGQKLLPNKPEKLLYELFQQLFPDQIKYTGDGKDIDFIIGGKLPDFVFVNGQKKIIEHFGSYWHGEEKTGRTKEEEEQQRIECFTKEGYQVLIIWEYELQNCDVLLEKIIKFYLC